MTNWDEQYKAGQGRYFPAEELVRFLGRTYGPVTERKGYNLSAIDIGCGVGGNLVALAEWGFFCLGLECSSEALRLARTHMSAKDLIHVVNFQQYIAPSGIKYPANATELVIDIQTIQHLSERDHIEMYKEVHRVLAVGGKFFTIHWLGDQKSREAIFPGHPELDTDLYTPYILLKDQSSLAPSYYEIVTKTYGIHLGKWAVIEAVKK